MQETPADPISTPRPSGNSSTATVRNASGGIKETIEQILIAFILAFVFRAFVVEAFVIPTGSMATTLLGAHTRFQCPDCGYTFDVNFGTDDKSDVPSTAPPFSLPISCPNCGFHMDTKQVTNAPVFFGDRILVLKYLYLFQHPKRWDVVVFKAPVDAYKDNYSVNYIKRLVGRPGESVMVLDGDIYVHPPGDDRFVVQTKPPEAQNALWRLVYDNDFRPQMKFDRGDLPPFELPWQQARGSGWNLNDTNRGRTFAFNGDTGTIRFNPDAIPTSQDVSDYVAYDQPMRPNGQLITRRPYESFPQPDEKPVSDLDLRLTYSRVSGDGPLELRLQKRDKSFVARLGPTDVQLFCETAGARRPLGAPASIKSGSRPMQVELSNADYRVTLRINGRVVFQTTPADYSPDMDALLQEYRSQQKPPVPQIEISADKQQCSLSHVSLWRDIYYYNTDKSSGPLRSATPDKPAVLGNDEYFVCGDNSLVSYDARWWPDPISLPDEGLNVAAGRVPGRFLLGKAFFVYWPAGFRPFGNAPNLIPNFADMRFIH